MIPSLLIASEVYTQINKIPDISKNTLRNFSKCSEMKSKTLNANISEPLSTCETSHWKEEAKIRNFEKFGQGFPSEEEQFH